MARWKPDAAGRLVAAAITLFDRQGYEATTVAEIAAAAGLTTRTFFRYFADKREVRFLGSADLQESWVAAVGGAPAPAGAMEAVDLGLEAVTGFFHDRHQYARLRARIVAANPELQERELIKLARLGSALAAALQARGVPQPQAELAAQTGVTVFHAAFARWVLQDDPQALRRLLDDTFADLRTVVAGPPSPFRS